MRLLISVKFHTYNKMKASHIHCNQRNFLQQKSNAFFLQVLKTVLHYYPELLQIYKRPPAAQYIRIHISLKFRIIIQNLHVKKNLQLVLIVVIVKMLYVKK